jgi:hypothetical protein
MSQTTLEQVIEAARSLPREDQRRLREWLQEQERQDAQEQQREEHLRQEAEKFRQAMNWLDEHRAQYLGQWVALDGDRLISHGADARKVYAEAKAAGLQAPFVELVTEEEKLPFCGGWLP